MATLSRRAKSIIFILIGIGLLIGLFLPAFIHGAADDRQICQRLSTVADKQNADFAKREEDLSSRREKRDQDLANRIDQRDARIEANRTRFDNNLIDHLTKLNARATTTDQKAAVDDFSQAVHAAVSARRSAVDVARQTFRSGVKTAIADRRTTLDQELSDFQSSATAAIAKAQSDCSAGVDATTIKSDLRTAISAARSEFQQDKAGTEKIGPEVTALATQRRDTVEKARSEFKSAIDAAGTKLKDVLGVRAG